MAATKSKKVQIYLFVSEEDVFWWRRARALRPGLERDGFEVHLVNRLSTDLETLKMAVEYQAIHVPRWRVEFNGEVWIDQNTIPTLAEVRKILEIKLCRTG